MANGKRFLAYEIVKRLEHQQQHEILQQLQSAVTTKEKDRRKKYKVFEVSSDIKPCYNERFLLQKLDYIHNNPVSGKWKLVLSTEEYFHLSAAFYELNKPHEFVRLTHWRDVGSFNASST